MKLPFQKGFLASLLLVLDSSADIIINDTTSPHQFWFSQSEYVVNETATNLVVTVQWQSGDRGYSGWVDYYTASETATAQFDYTQVAGRLYFSGPAPRTFSIPIKRDCLTESDETLRVFLNNTNAIITQKSSVVRITDGPCAPELQIVRRNSSELSVSWPSNATGFVLERSNDFETWIETTNYTIANGSYSAVAPVTNGLTVFRLRKPSP